MMERPEERRNLHPLGAADRTLTVSEITELIKGTLEDRFPWVTVQ